MLNIYIDTFFTFEVFGLGKLKKCLSASWSPSLLPLAPSLLGRVRDLQAASLTSKAVLC